MLPSLQDHSPRCIQTYHDDPSDPLFGAPYPSRCVAECPHFYHIDGVVTNQVVLNARVVIIDEHTDVTMARAGRFV